MVLIWGHISPEPMRYPELKNVDLTLWPIRKTSLLFSEYVPGGVAPGPNDRWWEQQGQGAQGLWLGQKKGKKKEDKPPTKPGGKDIRKMFVKGKENKKSTKKSFNFKHFHMPFKLRSFQDLVLGLVKFHTMLKRKILRLFYYQSAIKYRIFCWE